MTAENQMTGKTGEVGRLLRATREETRQNLRDVAERLRIRYQFLEAIEDGRYQDLPGAAYATGFVRAYAEYLGLDGLEIARRFKEEGAVSKMGSELAFPIPAPESGLPSRSLLLAGVAMLGVVYGVWHFVGSPDKPLADVVQDIPDRIAALMRSTPDSEDALKREPIIAPSESRDPAPVVAAAPAVPPAPAAPQQQVAAAPAPQASAPAPSAPATPAPATSAVATSAPAPTAPVVPPAKPAVPHGSTAQEPISSVQADIEPPSEEHEEASPVAALPSPTVALPSAPAAVAPPATAPVSTSPAPASSAPTASAPASPASGAVKPAPSAPNAPQVAPAKPATVPPAASAPPAAAPAKPAAVASGTSGQGTPVQGNPSASTITGGTTPQAATPTTKPAAGATPAPAPSSPLAALPTQPSPAAAASAPTPAPTPAQTPARVEPTTAPVERQGTDATGEAPLPQGRVFGEENSGARVVLKARADSWVQVRNADGLLMSRLLRKGDTYMVPNQGGLELMTGNAGGLDIVVDGKTLPTLGKTGEVRKGIPLQVDALKSGAANGQ